MNTMSSAKNKEYTLNLLKKTINLFFIYFLYVCYDSHTFVAFITQF
jgi:hypothetical protein